MSDVTPNLKLPLPKGNQAQKEVTISESIFILDVVQSGVLDRDLATPPGSPSEGDAYIVAASATGAWAGRETQIAYYFGSVWNFVPATAVAGTVLFVRDEGAFVQWVAGSPGAYEIVYQLYQPFIVSERLAASFSNAGLALDAETANVVYVRASQGGTIARITLLGAVNGDAEVDIWRDSFANYPPAEPDSIFSDPGASYPAISDGDKFEDDTLTDVDTTINAGDVLGFKLRSASALTQLTVYVEVQQAEEE